MHGSEDIRHILDWTECNRRHEYLCPLRSFQNPNIWGAGKWRERNETYNRLAIKKDLTWTTFKRRLRCFFFLSSIFGLQTVWTHSTYNSSTHVTTVRGGHDSRTFFCVAGTGSIFIHTVDGDGVNTIHITIVCTAVSRHTAISSCKRVDGTSFITTLGLNKWYKYISH